MIYLLIDTSYLIFYRYFALIRWWKYAKPDIELPINPADSEEFMEKFIKIFKESVSTIKKKLKLTKETCCVIAALDCPRKQIWRNNLYEKYKENRDKDEFMGGDFFRKVYNSDLLSEAGVNYIFKYPTLEADDILAITTNYIKNYNTLANIIIITNDHDYLQLIDENISIINLQYKNLKDNKKVFPEAKKNLFYKIILGDKSDNIEPVFTNCGPKTVEKYYNSPELLECALQKHNAYEKYARNIKLISFSEIPQKLIDSFIEENCEVYGKIINY